MRKVPRVKKTGDQGVAPAAVKDGKIRGKEKKALGGGPRTVQGAEVGAGLGRGEAVFKGAVMKGGAGGPVQGAEVEAGLGRVEAVLKGGAGVSPEVTLVMK